MEIHSQGQILPIREVQLSCIDDLFRPVATLIDVLDHSSLPDLSPLRE